MASAIGELTHNPYWDAVSQHVTDKSAFSWEHGALTVGSMHDWEPTKNRFDRTSEYAWTITSPETVAFVAEHLGGRAVDPMAGSGYWAYLLRQLGVDVLVADVDPPREGSTNRWHRGGAWLPMLQMDAIGAVGRHGAGRSLLLSWPPYDAPAGFAVLRAYTGNRVVYIGEGEGGCCGDDAMFALLDSEWTQVAEHRPVQWYGIHDWVTVYGRKSLDCGVGCTDANCPEHGVRSYLEGLAAQGPLTPDEHTVLQQLGGNVADADVAPAGGAS